MRLSRCLIVMVMVSSAVLMTNEAELRHVMTNLGEKLTDKGKCVQNMLMHCQPQTKANCVKIETKLNSISATTTSRQETSQIGGERTKRTRSRMSLRADEVRKPVGKPSAERSTSREEGADKDRKTIPKTAFSRSRAAGLSRKAPTKRSQNSERGDARVQEKRETFSNAIEAHVAACETLST